MQQARTYLEISRLKVSRTDRERLSGYRESIDDCPFP
jgi:hypothetical protein